MNMTKRAIADYLAVARTAIREIHRDEETAEALAASGYGDASIQRGINLLEAAQAQYQAEIEAYGDTQSEVLGELENAISRAEYPFIRYRRMAKIAHRKDPKRLETLGLNEPLGRTFDVWQKQAQKFYSEALADEETLGGLKHFGISREQVRRSHKLLEEAIEQDQMEECDENSDLQAAVVACDQAIDSFVAWFCAFRDKAKKALRDDPERLEALHLDAIP